MQDSTPKVSVVIPVYNEEAYIGECLESLMKQTTPPDEIIVVNNNSTDNSESVVKKYPVKLLQEKKRGIIPTRNHGFNKAQYEIIARTDADTILPNTWVEQIKKAFTDEQIIGISGPASFYDLPSPVKNSLVPTKTYHRIVRNVLKHDCLYGPNFAIRKSAWEKVKDSLCLDDKKVHEDLDLTIHLEPYGKIKFIRNLTVSTSSRRSRRPDAYVEYLYRGIKSISTHRRENEKTRNKTFLQKVAKSLFLEQPTDFRS